MSKKKSIFNKMNYFRPDGYGYMFGTQGTGISYHNGWRRGCLPWGYDQGQMTFQVPHFY